MIFGLPKSFPEEKDGGFWGPHDEPQMSVGECYMGADTNCLCVYVRFSEDVSKGEAVATKFPSSTAEEFGNTENLQAAAAAGSTVLQVLDPAGTTKLETMILKGVPKQPKDRDNALVYVSGGTGAKQSGILVGYDDTKMYVNWDTNDGGLKTALATSSDL